MFAAASWVALCAFIVAATVADAARVPRLAKGRNVTIQEYPYQVSMQYLFGYGDNRRHFCGGAILDKNHIMTAAHCIKNEPLDLVVATAGVTNVQDYNTTTRVELRIRQVWIHPFYRRNDFQFDLAVVELSGEFPLDGNWTAAVPLQTKALKAGTACSISGWGYLGKKKGLQDLPDILQAGTVTLADVSQCNNSTNLVCALGDTTPCEGDDGGPLVCGGRLVGLAQRPATCGKASYSVYTDIVPHAAWLQQQLSLGTLRANSTMHAV